MQGQGQEVISYKHVCVHCTSSGSGSSLQKKLLLLFLMRVFPACVPVHQVHAVPAEVRRGHQIP